MWRKVLAVWSGLLFFLSGCGSLMAGGACVGAVAPSQHPTARIVNGSVTVVRNSDGDCERLELTATTNQAVPGGVMEFNLHQPYCSQGQQTVRMYDDGKHSDSGRNDGIWGGTMDASELGGQYHAPWVMLSFKRQNNGSWYMPERLQLSGFEVKHPDTSQTNEETVTGDAGQ